MLEEHLLSPYRNSLLLKEAQCLLYLLNCWKLCAFGTLLLSSGWWYHTLNKTLNLCMMDLSYWQEALRPFQTNLNIHGSFTCSSLQFWWNVCLSDYLYFNSLKRGGQSYIVFSRWSICSALNSGNLPHMNFIRIPRFNINSLAVCPKIAGNDKHTSFIRLWPLPQKKIDNPIISGGTVIFYQFISFTNVTIMNQSTVALEQW